MSHSVAKDDGACAVSNGGRVQPLNGIGIGSNGVFGDVHGRKTVLDRELHCFFGGALEVLDRPVFHEAADRAATEKRCGFNGDAHGLRNFHDGANVVFMRSRGAVGLDLHPVRGDFAGQRFGVGVSACPSAGETDIDRVDSQGFHQMQDFDLFFDAGVVDRGILQTIAQGFVVHQDARAGRNRRRGGDVPVVDPFVLLHRGPRLVRQRSI